MCDGVRVGTVVLIVALMSLVSGAMLAFWWQRQFDAALERRPPVMILDLSAPARTATPGELPALVRAYRQAAAQWAAQGALVLERQMVLAAPSALVLQEAEVPHAP